MRALELMTALHDESDGCGLHLTGSIRLIEKGDGDRLLEAKQHLAMARLYDDPALPTTMIGADEIARLHPLVDVSNIECGVFTPRDGDVDPTMLTTAISRVATAHGAQFRFNAEVRDVRVRADGRFDVAVGDDEVLSADAVVNCAGLWSRRFSRLLGDSGHPVPHHPALVIEHQYAVTESLPELAGRLGDGERVPVLRDLAGSSYIRQERDGLLVGPYEREVALHTEWAEGPPANFAFDLFPPAMERIEDCLAHAMEVVPALGTVGIKTVVNGPTIWTGDSLARCGRTRLPGYYDFNSLTYGVAQSLALAEYLAHIIVEGEQPYDMATEFDPLRYGGWAGDAYTAAKVTETYSHNNSVSYPHENRPAGRDHVAHPPGRAALLAALGARRAPLLLQAGVEVPVAFFASAADAAAAADSQRTFASHVWAPYADAEAAHLLSATGVGIGYSSFSKLTVRGDGAAARRLLERCLTNALPKAPGRCRLTYATTNAGKVLAEFTVTARGGGGGGAAEYYLVGSRDYAQHDLAWLEQQRAALVASGEIASADDVEITDVTDATEILQIAGGAAAALVSELCADAAAIPFLQMREIDFLGVPAAVFRISFTGEPGYELHVSVDDVATLWERIWAHPAAAAMGLAPFGSQAVNALRIEKGFKVKSDLDYAHWTEAGIEPFVALGREGEGLAFLGRDAPPPDAGRRSAIFSIETSDDHAWSVPGDSPVVDAAGEVVGFTTTSARGASTGRTIALGYVRCGAGGDPVAVECYGNRWPLELLERPPVAVGGRPKKGA